MPNYGTFTRTNIANDRLFLTIPNVGEGGGAGINAQYNIYENRFYGGDTYWHYKTNIPTYGWSMHNIEAVGYSYGGGVPIRCNWCFHTSNGTFYSQELSNIYSGLSANRLYASGDNYVVFVATGPSYFSGWSINAYSLNPTGPFNVQITAAVQTSSNANYY